MSSASSGPESAGKPPASDAPRPAPSGGTATGPMPGQTLAVDNAAFRLGMVLQLARRARHSSVNELPFVMTNETRQLLPYRQAAFWQSDGGVLRLKSLSGLAAIDHNSPYVVWLNRFAKWRLESLASKTDAASPTVGQLEFATVAAAEDAPKWLGEWKEWLPPHAMDTILFGPGGWVCGYLCLFREAAFNQSEAKLFAHAGEAYGDSYGGAMMRPRRRGRLGWWRIAALIVAALALIAMFIPQPQTSLAQAEVAPRKPVIVRAGVEGVIEQFMVEPNQRVRAGQPLLRLEDTQFRTRLTVAEKAEEMARIELRQLQQAALHDPQSKSRLPLAQGRVEQLLAEASYVKTLLGRVEAASPMDGVALLENPDEWLGRPVSLGQKIMMVADPADVMLEIFLPVADSLPLREGDSLLFFPNIAPASPVRAKIVFVSYRAVETPGVGMAFRVRAEFEGSDRPMLGLRGMARLGGEPLPLGLIILRRPIKAVRQWLGW